MKILDSTCSTKRQMTNQRRRKRNFWVINHSFQTSFLKEFWDDEKILRLHTTSGTMDDVWMMKNAHQSHFTPELLQRESQWFFVEDLHSYRLISPGSLPHHTTNSLSNDFLILHFAWINFSLDIDFPLLTNSNKLRKNVCPPYFTTWFPSKNKTIKIQWFVKVKSQIQRNYHWKREWPKEWQYLFEVVCFLIVSVVWWVYRLQYLRWCWLMVPWHPKAFEPALRQ